MSFVVSGLTHCSKCGHSLGMNIKCPRCEEEENRNKQAKIDRLTDLSLNEIEALIILAKEKSKEIEKIEIKKQIEKLNKKLGE